MPPPPPPQPQFVSPLIIKRNGKNLQTEPFNKVGTEKGKMVAVSNGGTGTTGFSMGVGVAVLNDTVSTTGMTCPSDGSSSYSSSIEIVNNKKSNKMSGAVADSGHFTTRSPPMSSSVPVGIGSVVTSPSDSLPKQFVMAMRTLFDIMDDKGVGYIKFIDIENRWQDDGTKGLPKGVIDNLRKVTPPNGLLSFERFCAGLKICLLKNQVEGRTGTASSSVLSSNNNNIAGRTTNINGQSVVNNITGDNIGINGTEINNCTGVGGNSSGNVLLKSLLSSLTSSSDNIDRTSHSNAFEPLLPTNSSGRSQSQLVRPTSAPLLPQLDSNSTVLSASCNSSSALNTNTVTHSTWNHANTATVRPNNAIPLSTTTLSQSRLTEAGSIGIPITKQHSSLSNNSTLIYNSGPPKPPRTNLIAQQQQQQQLHQLQQPDNVRLSLFGPSFTNNTSSGLLNATLAGGLTIDKQEIRSALHNWRMGLMNENSGSSSSGVKGLSGSNSGGSTNSLPAASSDTVFSLSPTSYSNGANSCSSGLLYGIGSDGNKISTINSNLSDGIGIAKSSTSLHTSGSSNPTSLSRRRDPRRHTLQNGIDYYMLKRMKQIEQEKEVLLQGLQAVDKARDWYMKHIANVQERIKYLGRTPSHTEQWSEAHQERLELQRARILEVNRHLNTLTDSNGLPFHMNLAVNHYYHYNNNGVNIGDSHSVQQPHRTSSDRSHLHHQHLFSNNSINNNGSGPGCIGTSNNGDSNLSNINSTGSSAAQPIVLTKLKQQNTTLSEELNKKSDRITMLEREKASLIRELFQCRAQMRKNTTDQQFTEKQQQQQQQQQQ